jgi:hypothetical protein
LGENKMGRAERHRNAKNEKKERKTTYNLTREQLNNMVHERIEKELVRMKQEAMEEAVNTAMLLLLSLPLKVLMEHYWTKSYPKRMPEFINYVLVYYEQWQKGELDMDELREELWEYGGVRLEEAED